MTRDSVAGRQAVIGRSGGLGGVARGPGRRHVFVLVALFKAGMAGVDHLDRFLDEAGQYAATVKGGRPSSAVAVAVAVVEAGGEGPAATAWATSAARPPDRRRAGAFPVLVEVAGPRVVCPAEPPFLHRLVEDRVGSVLKGR